MFTKFSGRGNCIDIDRSHVLNTVRYSETRKIHGLRFADLLNLLCYDDRNHLTNFLMYQDTALPRGNLVPPQQRLAAE